jgi:hypothetical protein
MKKLILLALIPLAFAACQKAETTPSNAITVSKDTIPDGARIKVQLVMDSIVNDEIAIVFNHTFHNYYTLSNSEDETVPGAGTKLNIFALSSDGIALIVDGVPYTPGMAIPLDVFAKNSGPFLFKISYLLNIPSSTHIWCRDNYLKDSLDLRTGNYHFNIDNADTSSFGKNRFKIVVR